MGMDLQVNPNTVMRAYENLQAEEILYNRRGFGSFVSTEAKTIIRCKKRALFFEQLPALFRQARNLGIAWEEIEKQYAAYNNELHKES